MRLPLEGVRIIDLSWIIAGPLASRLLADFGADVIKVESRLRPDVGRANRTPLYGVLPGDANSNPDTGGYFQDVNGGKRSCTLNLQTEGGRALLARLVANADAVICNLGGDQLDRWGLPYERMRELNRGIIVINLPTMESHGPRARWKAFGDNFGSASGLKSISGALDEPEPLPFGHHYPDFGPNPFHGAIALMAALHERRRTGEGAFIEISQYEATTAVTGTMLLEYAATGVAPRPRGNADPDAVPHNVYRCARPATVGSEDPPATVGSEDADESWCAIAVYDGEQWQALSSIPGLEALQDPALSDPAERRRREPEIDATIEAWTQRWDRQELAEYLQANGVPAGPFQGIPEMVEVDPTLSTEHFARLPHPVGRDFLVHRSPLRMKRRPPMTRLAPMLGAETFEVLTEVAGLTPDEIAEYAAAGALE
jgi:crotonobetainyl-CoA:carnitine CoA-transferase CaiB-like acyl-CoA transferase